ncbi:hypothetical protein INT46_011947 [Mucor plumbeus]|uniref:Uncharacterized protein n=1 Tax=Mucor plumbeus TaxID=97098 RepID=A0A8H7R1I9_9FUNG|nr:hypothetical protein INT46_011947 [Mucor plumbeus]
MSLGSSTSSSSTNRFAIHQSLTKNKKKMSSISSESIVPNHYQYNNNSTAMNTTKNNSRFSYRTCPICEERLLVRINGSFVYKWISTHFSSHHHEWMHVVVNLHES